MKELARRACASPSVGTEDSNAGAYLNIRHYIGRIGSHMKATKTLVAAASRLPALFVGFRIECCPSPKPAERPPQMNMSLTLDGMVVRMLPQNDQSLPDFQEALQFMDNKFGIYQRMVKEYNDPKFLPRVHAELILLEHFYVHEYQFVDGDKYFGCSKPACYCCYHYICAHPGNFVRPASHNKIYLNWRPPDAVKDDPKNSLRQRDTLNTMIKAIRSDVLQQVKERRGPGKSHHDSTTGISASMVPECSRSRSRTTSCGSQDAQLAD
jgi:hypothetical protein